MKRRVSLLGLALGLALSTLFSGGVMNVARAETTLLVYTAVEPEWLPKYKKAFEDANPGIRIKWLREGTGTITARILAEKDAPRADVVFGLAASSLLVLKAQNMLEAYTPRDFDKLSPVMRDASDAPCWVGINAWATAFCVNRSEMEKRGLAAPQSWEDLLRPEYRDLIVMPDPAASGTGYMNLATWMQMWGEEKAWAYVDALRANLKMLSPSGARPAAMAAQGEIPVGVSSGAFGAPFVKRRAPLDIIVPDNAGWEMEASAIVRGTAKLEAARAFMDFCCSEAVAKIGAEFSGMPARPELVADKAAADRLAPIDPQWGADNRERLLGAWRARYGN